MEKEEILNRLKPKNQGGQLINELLFSGVIAHIEHLKATGSGSYARHMALGEYYESIPEVVDSFVEAYQAKFGLIEIPFAYKSTGGDFLKELKYLDEKVGIYQGSLSAAPDLANLCQEIQTVIKKAIYKLTFLS